MFFYNASLRRWYTTRNKFLTKIFSVIMPSYLTIATANVKIKLRSHFFLIPMAASIMYQMPSPLLWHPLQPAPPIFFRAKKFFFFVRFFHVNDIRDFKLLLIDQNINDKKDSFYWICCFSSKLSYHSYQQRVRKFLFLIRTSVKTNRNLMRGSFLLI